MEQKVMDRMIGVESGYLLVIERDYEHESRVKSKSHKYYKCLCRKCGQMTSVRDEKLDGWKQVSCGKCAQKVRQEPQYKHAEIKPGVRIGDYLVIDRIKSSDNGNKSHMVYFEVECVHCHQRKKISRDHLTVRDYHCSCQNGSANERKIAGWLTECGIPFQTQYTIGERYRMDFAIIGKDKMPKLYIEYDGEFHDNAEHYKGSIEDTQRRDAEKNLLAMQQGVPLLRIHHSEQSKMNRAWLLGRMLETLGSKKVRDTFDFV